MKIAFKNDDQKTKNKKEQQMKLELGCSQELFFK